MYSGYFGFTRPPFTDSDDQALSISPAHEAAYACLRQGLAGRCGVALLTGAAGIGKTSLLRRLTAELADEARLVFLWNPYLDFDELLNYLCDALELRATGAGRADRMQALEVFLLVQLMQGKTVILVLDEAQDLPGETLEGLHGLARLETAGQRLLQIVLSGQPTLEARLLGEPALRPLADDVGARCRLEPLEDEAVGRYIQERLRAAGHPGDDLFDADAVRKVVRFAHGIPRRINRICGQALMLAYLNSEQRVSAAMIREVAAERQLQERAPEPAALVAPQATALVGHAAEKAPGQRAPAPQQDALDEGFAVEPKAVRRRFRSPRRHRRLRLAACLLLLVAGGAALVAGFPYLPSDLKRLITIPLAFDLPSALNRSGGPPQPDEAATGPIPTPAEPRALPERVRRLLTEADQQRQLETPQGASAQDNYREALRPNPGNNEARRGLSAIKASLLVWADSAQARGDLAMMQDYLETVLAIDPNDGSVRTRLAAIRREEGGRTPARGD